jgi:hypothetical protein
MPIQYYMRAFKITPTVGYVDWIVNDYPDTNGTFSGYNPSELVNITVNKSVQSKVENFLKPKNNIDGYFFHINSYDWIHPPTPPFDIPIPPPPQIAGIAVVRGTEDGITPRDYATLYWNESSKYWEFAYNTNGDGYTIGDPLPVSSGSIFIDGYLEIGTNPAHSGIIRIPNSEFIKARNSSNTNDISIAEVDSFNRVQIGSATDPVYIPSSLRLDGYLVNNDPSLASLSGFIRNPNNTSIITFRNNTNTNDLAALSSSNNYLVIGDNLNSGINYNTGNFHSFQTNNVSDVEIGNNFIRFTESVEYPKIYQVTRSIGNGQNIVLQAQSTTDSVEYGGSVILDSGTGPGADGYVDIKTNNNVKIRVFGYNAPITADLPHNASSNPNSVLINNPTIRFYDSVINPTIKQDTVNIDSVSGQTLTILAQNNIGAGSIGGNLVLSSGNGLLYSGNVDIQTGSITKLRISPTTTTSYNSIITFDSSLSDPIINQTSLISGIGQSLTLQAQNSDLISGTGGDLILSAGDGYILGNVNIKTGSQNILVTDISNYLSKYYLRGFVFDKNVTSPNISQEDTSSAIAQDLRIQAQNANNIFTGYGGNLILSSGSGFDQNGKIKFQIDGTNFANAGIDNDGTYIDIGDIPATEGVFRIPNSTWIEARNSTNTGNIKLFGSNSFNEVVIGADLILLGSIDLPGESPVITHNFAIEGKHVGQYVTAGALNILTNGSNADGYHTHSGASSCYTYMVGKIGQLSYNFDGYLLSNLVEATNEDYAAFVVNKVGSLGKLIATCTQRPIGAETVKIIVRKNKSDTILTLTLDSSMPASTNGYIASDLSNVVSVAFGDWITIRFISSIGAYVENLMISLEN